MSLHADIFICIHAWYPGRALWKHGGGWYTFASLWGGEGGLAHRGITFKVANINIFEVIFEMALNIDRGTRRVLLKKKPEVKNLVTIATDFRPLFSYELAPCGPENHIMKCFSIRFKFLEKCNKNMNQLCLRRGGGLTKVQVGWKIGVAFNSSWVYMFNIYIFFKILSC